MDLAVKVGLMISAMVLLYAIASRFSEPTGTSAYTPTEPPPEPEQPEPEAKPTYDPAAEELEVRQRTVGEKTIRNYGFRTIDLRTGPPDKEDFFDELNVAFYDASTGYAWQSSFTVCTPKGIARFMREKGYDSLLSTGYIVVERYDIDVILKTVLDPADLDQREQPEVEDATTTDEAHHL